jgi:hypothetical protein
MTTLYKSSSYGWQAKDRYPLPSNRVLALSTSKCRYGISTKAHIATIKDGMEIWAFSDFVETLETTAARATEKAIAAQHVRHTCPLAIAALLARAEAHYAAKAKEAPV